MQGDGPEQGEPNVDARETGDGEDAIAHEDERGGGQQDIENASAQEEKMEGIEGHDVKDESASRDMPGELTELSNGTADECESGDTVHSEHANVTLHRTQTDNAHALMPEHAEMDVDV